MRKLVAMSVAMIVGSFLIYCTNSAMTDHDGGVIDAAAGNHECCAPPEYEWVVVSQGTLEPGATGPIVDMSQYATFTVILDGDSASCGVKQRWRSTTDGPSGRTANYTVWRDNAQPHTVLARYLQLEYTCNDVAAEYVITARREI